AAAPAATTTGCDPAAHASAPATDYQYVLSGTGRGQRRTLCCSPPAARSDSPQSAPGQNHGDDAPCDSGSKYPADPSSARSRERFCCPQTAATTGRVQTVQGSGLRA